MNEVIGLLWLPPGVKCRHVAPALKWSFVPPERLSVLCRGCLQAWDENTVPEEVMATLAALLDQGKFVPATRQRSAS